LGEARWGCLLPPHCEANGCNRASISERQWIVSGGRRQTGEPRRGRPLDWFLKMLRLSANCNVELPVVLSMIDPEPSGVPLIYFSRRERWSISWVSLSQWMSLLGNSSIVFHLLADYLPTPPDVFGVSSSSFDDVRSMILREKICSRAYVILNRHTSCPPYPG